MKSGQSKEDVVAVEKQDMQYGVWLRNGLDLSVKQVVAYAIEAEAAGWDGVFVSDSMSASEGYSDPWTVLAAIAVETERIRIGTWITPIPNKLPWRFAHITASLDRLSDGRLILGVGLGVPEEYRQFGGSYNPKALGRIYDEALDIITGLWTGEPFSYSGEFFRVNEGVLPVTPVQTPRIPLWMAAWWPHKKPFRRAAQWDGIMPSWPALFGGSTGPQGERATGSLEEELRALLTYYDGLRDDPGEVLLPDRPDEGYRDLCKELGATWLLNLDLDIEGIRQGPPA
jgi:alkanesulfonate monooxygenase SsuD/methylene tetrahydromethanopterin reductase-like flavin-dependent oxidoreductase (luciferase family)